MTSAYLQAVLLQLKALRLLDLQLIARSDVDRDTKQHLRERVKQRSERMKQINQQLVEQTTLRMQSEKKQEKK